MRPLSSSVGLHSAQLDISTADFAGSWPLVSSAVDSIDIVGCSWLCIRCIRWCFRFGDEDQHRNRWLLVDSQVHLLLISLTSSCTWRLQHDWCVAVMVSRSSTSGAEFVAVVFSRFPELSSPSFLRSALRRLLNAAGACHVNSHWSLIFWLIRRFRLPSWLCVSVLCTQLRIMQHHS